MLTASLAACPVTIRLALVRMPATWHSMMPRFTPSEAPRSSALTIRWVAVNVEPSRQPEIRQEARADGRRVEELPRDRAGRTTVPAVARVDRVDRGGRLLHADDREKALSRRQDVAEAGVLR